MERLHRQGVISSEEAIANSSNAQELRQMMRHA
jgi:hypothetical protein